MALLDLDASIGRSEELGKGHAERIVGMVDQVLAEAGYPLASLDAIAASIGPGAFTGVRITVAVAQGLAFGAGLPVAPVCSLEALAYAAVLRGASHVLACLDARMQELYFAAYRADALRGLVALSEPALGPPAQVRPPEGAAYRGIGRGFAAYPGLAESAGVEVASCDLRALPNAREIARLGRIRFESGAMVDPADLAPLYLRNKVALTEAERRR